MTKIVMSFSMEPATAERIKRAAKLRGVNVSEWLRQTLQTHFDGAQPTPTPRLPGTEAPPLPDCPPERAAVRMEPNPPLAQLDPAAVTTIVSGSKEAKLEGLRSLMGSIGLDSPVPSPTSIDTSSVSERFQMPHIIDGAGGCIGGCDPDLDALCSIGPDDPRRTGKRRQG